MTSSPSIGLWGLISMAFG
uniref:Uncharacterized protein n=1 Tax=Anguilla anguilla TaxID=7936 RepID=A0A0E9SIJ5_ANGAN